MTSKLDRAFSVEQFRRDGHRLIDALAEYLQTSGNETRPVFRWQAPDDALQYWKDRIGTGDTPDMLAQVIGDAICLQHPKFMGHQISPSAPVAALSSMVVDLLNNGMGIYEMGIPGTAIERVVVDATARRMGFGESAGGFLTSGGTLGNLTAMLSARSACVADDPTLDTTADSIQNGAVMVSDQAHYCIGRAARVMGWGDDGIIRVPTNSRFQMQTDQLDPLLKQAKANGKRVVAIVGCACSTSTGSFDDLSQIGTFCRQHGIWFHVDGAHGAALAFSEKYRHRLKGIEMADSVVMDYHKMLLVPAIVTAVIFRDARHGYQTFQQSADYLWSKNQQAMEWFNLAKRTFECTKSMVGLKIYSIIHAHGIELFDENVTRLVDLAADFATLITGHPQFELATEPQANIVCFRYAPPGAHNLDRQNASIREALLYGGEFYIVQTQLHGQTWLRTTLSNPFTTRQDLGDLLAKIEGHAAKLQH